MKLTIRENLRPPTLRAADDGTPGRFLEGYAAVFNSESAVLFDEAVVDEEGDPIPFVEVIDPHAFDRTLRENPDVRALYNHDTSAVLGRTKSGTLSLSVDAKGLPFRLELPDTQPGRDARVSVARGDLDGNSFGFYVRKDKVEQRPGAPALRTLLDVDLFEITVGTAFPAYEATTLALRERHERKRRPGSDPKARYEYERRRLAMLPF